MNKKDKKHQSKTNYESTLKTKPDKNDKNKIKRGKSHAKDETKP